MSCLFIIFVVADVYKELVFYVLANVWVDTFFECFFFLNQNLNIGLWRVKNDDKIHGNLYYYMF